MLAIEIDGGYHHHSEVGISDLKRQRKIESYGIHFLRFENKDIKQNIDSVVEVIEDWIKLNS